MDDSDGNDGVGGMRGERKKGGVRSKKKKMKRCGREDIGAQS